MDWVIEPIAGAHIAGFHAALDRVARERRYLALLEAPPLERTAEFVRGNIAGGNPQYVAVGFKVEGVKRDALRLDDGRFDLVVMALHLDGGG